MAEFIPKKSEKEIISLRMDAALLHQADEKAAAFGLSRNELLNQCIAFALEHLAEPPKTE